MFAPHDTSATRQETLQKCFASKGLAGVDVSGSTAEELKNRSLLSYASKWLYNQPKKTKETIMGLQETAIRALLVRDCAGWGSKCGEKELTSKFCFHTKNETTQPTTFFQRYAEYDPSGLVFSTDGEIGGHEIRNLSKCRVPDVPAFFIIAGNFQDSDTITKVNISVIYSLFQKCSNALVLVVYSNNGVSDAKTDTVRVVAARGETFTKLFLFDLPEGAQLKHYPRVSYEELNKIELTIRKPIPNGSILLNNNTTVNVHQLLTNVTPGKWCEHMDKQDLMQMVSFLNSSSELSKARAWLNTQQRWLTDLIAKQRAPKSTQHIQQLLQLNQKLGTVATASKQQEVREKIMALLMELKSIKEEEEEVRPSFWKQQVAKVQAALAFATDLEQSGMTLRALARPSNRAKRFAGPQHRKTTLLPMQTLNARDAPLTLPEDLILMTEGPVTGAIFLKLISSATGDSNRFLDDRALDFPFGLKPPRAILSGWVAVPGGIADHFDQLGRSTCNDTNVLCLPVLSLQDPTNKIEIYKRLSLVFTDGLAMPHVWQILLLDIVHTLSHPWADPATTDVGRLLSAFGKHVGETVCVSGKHRYAIGGKPTPLFKALRHYLDTDILSHESLPAIIVICRVLKLWCTAPEDTDFRAHLDNVVSVAACQTIIDRRLQTLKTSGGQHESDRQLLRAIYRKVRDVHTGTYKRQQYVPVVGSETLPLRWKDIGLTARDCACLKAYPSEQDLMHPAAAGMVAFAALKAVNANQSQTAARRAVCKASSLAQLLFTHPSCVGSLRAGDVLDEIRAIQNVPYPPRTCVLPPFVKGSHTSGDLPSPSTLFYYSDRSGIVSMAPPSYVDGMNASGPLDADFVQFIKHQRQGFNQEDHGWDYVPVPIHKMMVAVVLLEGLDPNNSAFVSRVMHHLQKYGRGNLATPHIAECILALVPSLVAALPDKCMLDRSLCDQLDDYRLQGRSLADTIRNEIGGFTVAHLLAYQSKAPPQPVRVSGEHGLGWKKRVLQLTPPVPFDYETARTFGHSRLAYFLFSVLTTQRSAIMDADGGIPSSKLLKDDGPLSGVNAAVFEAAVDSSANLFKGPDGVLRATHGHQFPIALELNYTPYTLQRNVVYQLNCCPADLQSFKRLGKVYPRYGEGVIRLHRKPKISISTTKSMHAFLRINAMLDYPKIVFYQSKFNNNNMVVTPQAIPFSCFTLASAT